MGMQLNFGLIVVKNLSIEEGSWLFDSITPWLPEHSVADISLRMAERDDLDPDRIIWRLSHDGGLKTNLLRWERGCLDSDSCPLCGVYVEIDSHIMRDCVQVDKVWRSVFGAQLSTWQIGSPAASWISQNIGSKSLHSSGVSWSLLFGVTCWLIWLASQRHVWRDVRWEPPWDGWVKWNLDGSVSEQGVRAAGGCVLRNSLGRWIIRVARNIGHATITEAELWAFKDASFLSKLRGDSWVWFESDSFTTVNFVKNGVPASHPCFGLVSAIQIDIGNFERVHIRHVLREGNSVVDGLAGLGHSLPLGSHVLPDPPACVSSFLLADASGVSFPRFCYG
ncbi:Ribonuclease H-like superfamily [Sesbania bispinosa]|nr:Ribonuclease H-like superfamily [Sesbania bispinosa]